MRGDHHGRTQPVHLLEQQHQPLRLRAVQVPRRLVGQQQAGAVDDRTGDGDALLLAARQFRRTRIGPAREAHPAQHFGDIGPHLALGASGEPQRQGDIVEGRQMRQQPEILEHHADPPAQGRQDTAARTAGLGVQQGQAAAGGPDREVHQAQQTGLAGARGAQQPAEHARVQLEADVVQHLRAGRPAGLAPVV